MKVVQYMEYLKECNFFLFNIQSSLYRNGLDLLEDKTKHIFNGHLTFQAKCFSSKTALYGSNISNIATLAILAVYFSLKTVLFLTMIIVNNFRSASLYQNCSLPNNDNS